MLRVVVCVSGGGTNLQAIIDAVENGTITNTELVGVISNNKNAYALTRAGNHQIPAQCVSPKDFETREEFNKVFLEQVLMQRLYPQRITRTVRHLMKDCLPQSGHISRI